MTFCCKMRERFLLGIVAERTDLPVPVEAVDFIDFGKTRPDGKPLMFIKFCPFCGKQIGTGPMRTMVEG